MYMMRHPGAVRRRRSSASVREGRRGGGVTHVSVYPLTIEPHTPFDAAVLAGDMDEPDDDVEAAHMQVAARVLEEAGFARYEVASYARPGFECRHNTAYWTGKPYLGLGRSAATMTQNAERRMRVQDGQVTDDLDARQMAAEDLMLGMRMARGVACAQVEAAVARFCPKRPPPSPNWKRRAWWSRWRGASAPPTAAGSAATSSTAACTTWPRKDPSPRGEGSRKRAPECAGRKDAHPQPPRFLRPRFAKWYGSADSCIIDEGDSCMEGCSICRPASHQACSE